MQIKKYSNVLRMSIFFFDLSCQNVNILTLKERADGFGKRKHVPPAMCRQAFFVGIFALHASPCLIHTVY
jgi:hypothetical protein